MIEILPDLNSLLRDVARPAPVHFREIDTVFQALARLRSESSGAEPVYFYVTDSNERLVGVVPTRRLVFADPSALVGEVMIHPVIYIEESAPFRSALALLAEQRLLALPVVNEMGRLTGVVDLSGLTHTVAELERRERADEIFHVTSLRVEQEQRLGLRYTLSRRFGWFLVSVAGGLACAVLLELFAAVLTKAIAVAFFVPLVVLIAERIAAQTTGASLRRHQIVGRINQPQLGEWRIGLALAGTSAVVAGAWAASWLRLPAVAGVVACSVLAASTTGLAAGYIIPRLVRRWHLERRVPMVPMALAVTDITALSCYLVLAGGLLR